jgi:hypothetical protein
MAILPKAIYRFNAMLIQNSNVILCRNRKIDPKFIWKIKTLQIPKAILSKKTDTGGITILSLNYTTEPQ